jgi:hypothetical protein
MKGMTLIIVVLIITGCTSTKYFFVKKHSENDRLFFYTQNNLVSESQIDSKSIPNTNFHGVYLNPFIVKQNNATLFSGFVIIIKTQKSTDERFKEKEASQDYLEVVKAVTLVIDGNITKYKTMPIPTLFQKIKSGQNSTENYKIHENMIKVPISDMVDMVSLKTIRVKLAGEHGGIWIKDKDISRKFLENLDMFINAQRFNLQILIK